jgi:hypothetical protein
VLKPIPEPQDLAPRELCGVPPPSTAVQDTEWARARAPERQHMRPVAFGLVVVGRQFEARHNSSLLVQ